MSKTKYSISAASRITGKSRATISRHTKAGTLSFELDRDNNKLIEGSELVRVYGDECDFSREEKRGRSIETARSESKPTEAHAAINAVREEQIKQYMAQIEHLQQALDKAQDSQNRITLLLEQRTTERTDWQDSLDAMAKTIADQTESQIKQLRTKHEQEILQLKRALHKERHKSLWQRLWK
ncbi:MAG: hypothetical protein KDA44_02580 [Planctomycetales bacterium]|nr:hypothetical protein [Planctomycetales bacterium]